MSLSDAGAAVSAPGRGRATTAAWVIAVLVSSCLAALDSRFTAALLAAAIGVGAWMWPVVAIEITAFAVLVVRPVLDVFGGRRLGLGPFASNPAVLLGLGVLWLAVIIGVRRAQEGRSIWAHGSLERAHWWLAMAYLVGW